LTRESIFPKMVAAAGINPEELYSMVVEDLFTE